MNTSRLPIAVLVILSTTAGVFPQTQSKTLSQPCDVLRGRLMVQQQLEEAKGLDDPVARIAILIKVADLLWPVEQEAAREAFTTAYNLAADNFRERGDGVRREGKGLVAIIPDQRFIVIRAIARRDREWAWRLADKAVQEATQEQGTVTASQSGQRGLGEKFIQLANSLLRDNLPAALEFARVSLRYAPSSHSLPAFLFEFAGVDKAAADQFYLEALTAYAGSSIHEFLYLSSYPFGTNRPVGQDALSIYSRVPPEYVRSGEVQQLFLASMIKRARQALLYPKQPVSGGYHLPESAQIHLALTGLEPLIAQYQPQYTNQILELRTALATTMAGDVRQTSSRIWEEQQHIDSKNRFADTLEKIEKESNPDRKDRLIVNAVLAGIDTESQERLEGLAAKLSDVKVREQLTNWMYLRLTQRLIRDDLLNEAGILARRVSEVDQRAYLFFEIANEALKKREDKVRAHESLDEVVTMARRAPNTTERARALLGVTHLYAKFDSLRALEVLTDAVKTINRLTAPDLSRSHGTVRIEGRDFSSYTSYPVAGFSLENVFREMGSGDFDGALLLAQSLENKSLRATAIIGLASRCFEEFAGSE